MGDEQGDGYAARREDLDRRFRELPAAGSAGYWQHVEQAREEDALPLEVLARCLRERIAAGATDDAARVCGAVFARIQRQTQAWAWRIAHQARGGMRDQLAEDLEQECYETVWRLLAGDGPSFALEHFYAWLTRLQQHVAHDQMERAGEWQRKGVETPTRPPRRELESADERAEREHDAETGTSGHELADQASDDPFERVELASDLLAALGALSAQARSMVYDAFVRELTQNEIAKKWNITDRTVRSRLAKILKQVRARYLGGEEDHGGR